MSTQYTVNIKVSPCTPRQGGAVSSNPRQMAGSPQPEAAPLLLLEKVKKRRAVMMRLISCSMWAAAGLRDQWGMSDLGPTKSFSCLSKLVDDIQHSWDKRRCGNWHTMGFLTFLE